MKLPFRFLPTRYTLRALLVAVAIVALLLGWVTSAAYRKKTAIDALRSCGASLTFDYQWSESGAWLPNAQPPGSSILKRLLGEYYASDVVEVQLFADRAMKPAEFTDATAERISALTKVRWLVLMDTNLSDVGLWHFKELVNLERLDVERTRVTCDGARRLKQVLPKVILAYTDENGDDAFSDAPTP